MAITEGQLRLYCDGLIARLAARELVLERHLETREEWLRISAHGIAERMLAAVFRKAKIAGAHAHRFRHTLATDVLARGGTMADLPDVLGSTKATRKSCSNWPANLISPIRNISKKHV